MKKTAQKFVMYLLTAGAVLYLVREGMLSGDKFVFAPGWALWLCAGSAVFIVSIAGSALRFQLLMQLMRISPPAFGATARCFFRGLLPQFFATQLAFDAMRAYFLGKNGVAGGDIAGSIFVDRLLGIAAFVFFACIGFVAFVSSQRFLLAVLVAAALVLVLPIALIGWRHLAAGVRFRFLSAIPGSTLLCRAADSLARLRNEKGRLFLLQVLAIFTQLCQLLCVFCVSRALKNVELPPFQAIVAGAIASLTGLLPLPLAGVGVGESVFGAAAAELRQSGGPADFAPIFLLNRLLFMTIAVLAWLPLSIRLGGDKNDGALNGHDLKKEKDR